MNIIERKRKANLFRGVETFFNATLTLSCIGLIFSVVVFIWATWQFGLKCICTTFFLTVLSYVVSEAAREKAEEYEKGPLDEILNPKKYDAKP